MAQTDASKLRQAERLPASQATVEHRLVGGWTVIRMETLGDLVREGGLMGNCLSPAEDVSVWRNNDEELEVNEDLQGTLSAYGRGLQFPVQLEWSNGETRTLQCWDDWIAAIPDILQDGGLEDSRQPAVQEVWGLPINAVLGGAEYRSLHDPQGLPHAHFLAAGDQASEIYGSHNGLISAPYLQLLQGAYRSVDARWNDLQGQREALVTSVEHGEHIIDPAAMTPEQLRRYRGATPYLLMRLEAGLTLVPSGLHPDELERQLLDYFRPSLPGTETQQLSASAPENEASEGETQALTLIWELGLPEKLVDALTLQREAEAALRTCLERLCALPELAQLELQAGEEFQAQRRSLPWDQLPLPPR